MTFRLAFRPDAELDLVDAYRWYEERAPGVGDHLLEALDATLALLAETPLAFPIVHRSTRRALLRRFPYAVYFLVDASVVSVIAVFHVRRDPRGWHRRP